MSASARANEWLSGWLPWRPLQRAIQRRWQSWWWSRLPRHDALTLTQRNVYIVPTRAGFMLGLTLLVLLIGSINYQLNLGYMLTFLLGGCALVSTYVAHGTLRGLTLALHPPEPQHAGTPVRLRIRLLNTRKAPRHGIGLRLYPAADSAQAPADWVWCDVPSEGSCEVELLLPHLQRGLHTLPTLTAETRFPLGIFRVWTLWRPAAQVLIYPRAESPAAPLPPGEPHSHGGAAAHHTASHEFDGVRPYRRGDPLKSVVWKKAAKSDELVSRDSLQSQHFQLWLDLALSHGADLEQGLSRICAWALAAQAQELDYGLRLPHHDIPPSQGEAHLKQCLQALALYTPAAL